MFKNKNFRIIYFLVFSLFLVSYSFSQEVKSVKDYIQYRDSINKVTEKLRKNVAQLKGEIENINQRYKKESLTATEINRLNEKISQYHYNLKDLKQELEKAKADIERYKKELQKTKTENTKLKEKLKEFGNTINNLIGNNLKQADIIVAKDSMMQKLYQEAKNTGENDFKSGEPMTTISFFKKNDPVLFFDIGYKFSRGFSFELVAGTVINRDKNIFVGLGTFYEHFNQQNEGMVGVFLSPKISLGSTTFVLRHESRRELDPEGVFYLISDFGYTFALKDEKTLKGGIYTNLGFGAVVNISKNIGMNLGVSWRRIAGKKRNELGSYDRNTINSLDLKVGFEIYFGR